jgi:hypothetical protein
MATWRTDPYLWVHLAGLATVPLWLDLCLLGLAVGNPTLPGVELGAIAALGVLPVLAMQLLRPFYIFSLPGLALRPRALRVDQRQLLTQFRTWRSRLGALLVPVPLVWLLIKLYPLAFLARELTPFGDWGRLGGVAIATVGFALANLFLQVPAAVLQVLATPDRRMAAIASYPVERIGADFMVLGLPLGRLLPDVVGYPAPSISPTPGVMEAPVLDTSTPPTVPANPEVLPTSLMEPEEAVTEESITEVPVAEVPVAATPVITVAVTGETFTEESMVQPAEVLQMAASGAAAEPETGSSAAEALTEEALALAIAEDSPLASAELTSVEAIAPATTEFSAVAAIGLGETAPTEADTAWGSGAAATDLHQADPDSPPPPAVARDTAPEFHRKPFVHPELEEPDIELTGVDGASAEQSSLAPVAIPVSAPGQKHNP